MGKMDKDKTFTIFPFQASWNQKWFLKTGLNQMPSNMPITGASQHSDISLKCWKQLNYNDLMMSFQLLGGHQILVGQESNVSFDFPLTKRLNLGRWTRFSSVFGITNMFYGSVNCYDTSLTEIVFRRDLCVSNANYSEHSLLSGRQPSGPAFHNA